jgi:hypothetical protein
MPAQVCKQPGLSRRRLPGGDLRCGEVLRVTGSPEIQPGVAAGGNSAAG